MVEEGNAALCRMLHNYRIDCCFTSRRPFNGDWIPLTTDPLVAWVPREWSESEWSAFPLAKLPDYPFIMPLPGSDTDAAMLLAQHSMSPNVLFSANDNYTTWRMVEAGLGISVNNQLMSSGWSGEVVVLPFDPPQEIELGVAVLGLGDASPATRAFIDCAQNWVGRNAKG